MKKKLLGIAIEEKDLKRLAAEAVKNKFSVSSFARHLIFKALQPKQKEVR